MITANYSQWQAVSASILQPSHCLLKESYVTLSYEPYKSRFSVQKGSMQHVENVKHSPKDNLYRCFSTTKLNTALVCINLFSLHKQAKKKPEQRERFIHRESGLPPLHHANWRFHHHSRIRSDSAGILRPSMEAWLAAQPAGIKIK